ncbi:MAG: hypothetical protein JRI25_11475 [Deltaproteobacteria bacterium]|nr:hypothetical protein [Deltaproteobacteria bacterium]
MYRFVAGVAVALMASTPAMAGQSEGQDLLFADAEDIFQGLEFDTGRLPATGPLAVRFYVESNGGYTAEMEAVSDLWWPDPLTHGIVGLTEGGWMALVTDLDLAAQVIVDLSAIGVGVMAIDVWSESVDFVDEAVFDGLLLQESAVRLVTLTTEGAVIGPLEYTQSIFTGVNLVFRASAHPAARAVLSGVRVETGDQVYRKESDLGLFPVPEDDPGFLALTSTYYGWLDAGFDLVIVPEVEVCAPVIGCLQLVSFEIPIPLTEVEEERAFVPADYAHPLPSLGLDLANYDFGEVLVGNTVNLEVALENFGLLDLEGTAAVSGDEVFAVFPEAFYAQESLTDGVVVSFTPLEEGAHTALLTLTSNDPLRPSLEIPLLGTGVLPESEDDEMVSLATETRCGCSSVLNATCAIGALSPR